MPDDISHGDWLSPWADVAGWVFAVAIPVMALLLLISLVWSAVDEGSDESGD